MEAVTENSIPGQRAYTPQLLRSKMCSLQRRRKG
jgi:hypothetical protein